MSALFCQNINCGFTFTADQCYTCLSGMGRPCTMSADGTLDIHACPHCVHPGITQSLIDSMNTVWFYCQNPTCGNAFEEHQCGNWDQGCAGAICRTLEDPTFDIHFCPECNTCALTVSLLDELPIGMPLPPLHDVDPYEAMREVTRAALQKQALAQYQCSNCDQFGHEEQSCDALPPHPRLPCGICDRAGHYEESCEALPPHLRL